MNTCRKSHCNLKLTNINPDVLHSPHEVVGELGRGHNYWNVFQAVFEWKSTGGDNRKDEVFRLEFGGSKICNKSRLWRFQMSKSIGQSESLRHWLGKGRMGCSMPVRKGLRKPGWRQMITWSVFLHLFCLEIFFLVMSMESVIKLSLKRSLSETFHDAGVIIYKSKSIFPR